MNDVTRKVSIDIEVFGGAYLEIVWSKIGGQIASISHIDYTKVRSNKDNTQYWIKDWNDRKAEAEVVLGYNKAFEITGISRLSAAATKPAGLNSGVALREYQDIETERFMLVGQRYEDLFMQAAKHIIDLSKELYEVFPKFHVVVKTNKFVKKIKWADVDMKEDEFVMDVYPVNMLPSTPAGKLQTIQELIQAGLIPQDQALTLLDFPDLEHFMSLRTAAQDNIEKMLGIMIEEGRYIAPEPFMNLQLALELTQETYLRAKCDNLEEDKLDLLRTFMDDINTLLGANQPLPPPEEVGGPVAPGPMPGPADLGVAQGAPLPPPGPIGIA